MIPKPHFQDAPGLSLKPLKDKWQARWRARQDLIAHGYRPKTIRLWAGTEPTVVEREWVSSRCQILQNDMLVWANGGVPQDAGVFDGTLNHLMHCYRTDPVSNYAKLEFCTRRYYDRLMGMIARTVWKDPAGNEHVLGETQIRDISGRLLHLLHQIWTDNGRKISIGHALIGMLRTLVNFGDAILDDAHCRRLAEILHKMRFENGKPRTVRITREQVIAICNAARPKLPMVALAQALQFECTWRQKDVLGEWVPISEAPMSDVLDGNQKWIKGLRWEEIDNDFIVHHVTSKRKKLSEPDLKLAPLVLAEFEYLWPGSSTARSSLPSAGPVIIDRRRGLPYYADDFRAEWRKLATTCGVPLTVQNRDARAGAISEAIALGAEPAHVRDAATHSNLEQTYDYSRANRENTATVMKLRRDKTGT